MKERGQKPLYIGVVSVPATIGQWSEGVNGSEPLSQRTEFVTEQGNGLFVGDGDVEPTAPHGLQSFEHGGEIVCAAGQCHEAPVEPHRLQGCVLHYR